MECTYQWWNYRTCPWQYGPAKILYSPYKCDANMVMYGTSKSGLTVCRGHINNKQLNK